MLGEGPAFKAIMEHQATLIYLVEALDFSKKSDYEQRFQLQTASLWILTNLSVEYQISKNLVGGFKICAILQAMMVELFIDRPSSDNQKKLSTVELEHLDCFLSLTYNLACDFPSLFHHERFADSILLVTQKHNLSFQFIHWNGVMKILCSLSEALQNCELKRIDPFFEFLLRFGNEICKNFTRISKAQEIDRDDQISI